jgi:hypothetical protein
MEPALQTPIPDAAVSHTAEMHHIVKDIDYLLKSISIDQIKKLSFNINDIPFHITHKNDAGDSESRVCIQAVLGYLPFSINAGLNRQAILTILVDTHKLFHVRFGLDHHGRIFAAGNFTTDTLTSPNFMFYPLTCFLQEAWPFIELIGKYL